MMKATVETRKYLVKRLRDLCGQSGLDDNGHILFKKVRCVVFTF